ncbi:MAG TPA: serine/threonine-protein kinase [Ktedonobacterales bacterium]
MSGLLSQRPVSDRYRLLAPLGYGALGRVFAARRAEEAVPIAVKVLHPSSSADPGAADQVRRAYALAQRVRHPAVMPTLDCVIAPDSIWIVQELDSGESLATATSGHAKWLPRHPRTWLRYVETLAAGLGALHGAGLIHGDLKPSNIRLLRASGVEGSGLEQLRYADYLYGHVYATRQLMRGEARAAVYFAPEQFAGEVSARSDVYGLGALAYLMLTRQPPFAPHSLASILDQKAAGLPDQDARRPQLEAALHAVLSTALRPDPAQRFTSVAQLMDALREAVSRLEQPPDDEPSAAMRVSRRQMLAFGAGAVTAFAALAAIHPLTTSAGRAGTSPTSAVNATSTASPLGPQRAFRRTAVLKGHSAEVNALAWSPDGQVLVSGGNDTAVLLWRPSDAATAPGTLVQAASGIFALAFAPDGARVAAGCRDGTIIIADPQSGQPPLNLMGHQGAVRALAWLPDGKHLVSGSADTTLRIWDGTTGALRMVLGGSQNQVRAVLCTGSGDILSSGLDGVLRLWNSATGKQMRQVVSGQEQVFALALSPNSAQIASAGLDPHPRIWSLDALVLERVLFGPTQITRGLAWSSDGHALAASSEDGTVLVQDPLDTTAAGETIPIGSAGWAVTWQPHAATFAVGTTAPALQLWSRSG